MKTAIVFSHYDSNNIVKDYVVFYLRELSKFSENIIFVSTSKLSENETNKVKQFCKQTIVRENVGYDFYSYKIGLEYLIPYQQWDEIILCNDSIFAPIFPFDDLFSKMRKSNCDFWGPTISYDITPHIQSFFIVFNKRCIESEVFVNFWNNLKIINERDNVITMYELGFSKLLLSHGFICDSFFKVKKWEFYIKTLKALNRLLWKKLHMRKVSNLLIFFFTANHKYLRKSNPTFLLWDVLVQSKVPILKKSLLKMYDEKNQRNEIINVIKKHSNYNVDMLQY